MVGDFSTLNISLEPHLVESLLPVRNLVPADLAAQLEIYLSESHPPIIPYDILLRISQWSHTPDGLASLQSSGHCLVPQAYSMIALLAGTKTFPDRTFPEYVPPKSPEVLAAERLKERKEIATLINALLSIAGAGFAAYWASDKTGWKNEWRVLLSLFTAFLVAASETILYIIWQSRQTMPRKYRRNLRVDTSKKDDGSADDHSLGDHVSSGLNAVEGLRQRLPATADE